MIDWTKYDLIPRKGLLGWWRWKPGEEAPELTDHSGNSRNLISDGDNDPVLVDAPNGGKAWELDGTVRLRSGNETPFNAHHAIVIALANGLVFNNFAGLLTAITGETSSNSIFVGENGSDLFYDFGDRNFRRWDVSFAANNQKAAFGDDIGVFEMSSKTPFVMDGFQVGQQTSFGDRGFSGRFYEALVFNRILTDAERYEIYSYIAMAYHIWPRAIEGLTEVMRFPFAANKSSSQSLGAEIYYSEPYSGPVQALSFDEPSRSMALPFMLRRQEEYEAAEQFYLEHESPKAFAFRDYRFFPYKDRIVRFNSNLDEAGAEVTYRFNYSFEVVDA